MSKQVNERMDEKKETKIEEEKINKSAKKKNSEKEQVHIETNKDVANTEVASNRSRQEEKKEEKGSESTKTKKKKKKQTKSLEDEQYEPFDEITEIDYEIDDEKKDRSKKKLWMKITTISFGCILLAVILGYGIMAYYFTNHFYPNTKINNLDCSYKTVEEVERYFKNNISEYELIINGLDGVKDVIKSQDIGMKYDQTDQIKKIMENQNTLMWPTVYFDNSSEKAELKIKYDEASMKKIMDGLHALTVEQIPSQSAKPEFNGQIYEIKPEVIGTAIQRDLLEDEILEAVLEQKKEIDLVKEKCYKAPEFTQESKEVKDACDLLNKYIQTEVTYLMPEKVVIDAKIISEWLSVDDKMHVEIKDDAIKEWLRNFGIKYDTIGATRRYTAPSGKEVEVSGGTYGWSVDEKQEAELLKEHVKKGEKVQREPVFVQKAASGMPQDFGDTYIDIDLSMQRMWYVQNGSVVIDTPVVTGKPVPEKVTPTGVFSVLEKELNKTLIGQIMPETGKPEYKVPVSYWLRVTWSGIGIHDTSYRSSYGGTIYETDGSHGCINTPYDQVQSLYNMASVGTPVVIHY